MMIKPEELKPGKLFWYIPLFGKHTIILLVSIQKYRFTRLSSKSIEDKTIVYFIIEILDGKKLTQLMLRDDELSETFKEFNE